MSPSIEAERDLEHLVFEIAKGVSAETGEAFFRSLVLHLGRALHADYVFVGALRADAKGIASLAVHAPLGVAADFEDQMAASPCARIVEMDVRSFPSGVRQLFPQDMLLQKLGAE